MDGNYLALKYKAIKLTSEYSDKQLIDFGWKCRKYQRWELVQVSDGDNLRLKQFGDSAIEENEIDFELLPRVNEIFLNVARWRLDKQELSIEPALNDEWEHARDILKSTIQSPKLGYLYLAEKAGEEINELPVELVGSWLTKYFIASIICARINKRATRFNFSDLGLPLPVLIDSNITNDEIAEELLPLLEIEDVFDISHALGLPSIESVSFEGIENISVSPKVQEIVKFGELPKSVLIEIKRIDPVFSITLNSNNSFIKTVERNNELKAYFELFWKAYASAADQLPVGDQKVFHRHQSYLALKLEEYIDSESFSER